MERLPEGIDSKFRYVLLVSKRAEQLIQGVPPKTRGRHTKAARIAMDEVNQGLVRWQIGEPIEQEGEPLLEGLELE